MVGQVISEGVVIENGDGINDDRDQQRELFDLIDEMESGERAATWISVTRIPIDAEGHPLPNAKSEGQLFSAPLGTMSAADIIARGRKFIRIGQTSIMIRVTGSKKGQRGALFHKFFTVERENEEPQKETGSAENLFRLIQENQRIADERNQTFQERLLQMQQQALTRPGTLATDPIDQMTKMMVAMGGMMGAMMAGRPLGAPAVATVDPIDQFSKMFTLMQRVTHGGSIEPKEESIGDIVKSVASVVGPALQIFAANKQQEVIRAAQNAPKQLAGPARRPRPPAVQVPAAPARDPNTIIPPVDPTAQTPASETPLTEEQKMELDKMKSNLRVVCGLIESGKTPAEVAKLVLTTIPEEDDENFFNLVSDDSFVDHCALLEDQVSKHREFFVKLREEILAAYEPDTQAG